MLLGIPGAPPGDGQVQLPSPDNGDPFPPTGTGFHLSRDAPASTVLEHVNAPEPDAFQRLQRRLFLATLAATALAFPASWLLFDSATACSLLVGALSGLLYLRLLARSVSRLGGQRRSLGRFQLMVPVVLVLACSRFPALDLLPALVGFLLYKPALLLQAFPER
jgi:ATP synthase protein I